jgi:large subunit ribosomal protein L20
MRIKRSLNAKKKRKKVLKSTKGFLGARSTCYRKAKEAAFKAGKYAYRDRRVKKRTRRALWQIKIGNAAKKEGINYSSLINALKKNELEVDRKILALIAEEHPLIFSQLVLELKVSLPAKKAKL